MNRKAFVFPTPFTPPTKEEDAILFLRLIRSRKVGPATFWRLLADYGDISSALAALPARAEAAGLTGYRPCPEAVARAELRRGEKLGARLLSFADPGYPAALRDLNDAPPLLWCQGDIGLLARPAVAVIGARNASSLGLRMARRLADGLSEAGLVVISGLARGIDTAAHAAALSRGTISVEASGLGATYPPENQKLAAEIAAQGLRLSEQAPEASARSCHFPQRNRLIAALSRAVVVTEAAARSGSLITAHAALSLGREVLAVPGHPVDPRAAGCNALIRDGATLVRDAGDVLEVLRDLPQPCLQAPTPEPASPPRHSSRTSELERADTSGLRAANALHQQILDRLTCAPLPEDELIRDMGGAAPQVSAGLLSLELEGRVQRGPGGMVTRLH